MLDNGKFRHECVLNSEEIQRRFICANFLLVERLLIESGDSWKDERKVVLNES